MRTMECIDCPSPNYDDRTMAVSMIVLHYTGMPDAEGALDRLTSPDAQVSAHYLVDEGGQIFRLVDEAKRAWHAGKSRWRGITDINSASVGIERMRKRSPSSGRPSVLTLITSARPAMLRAAVSSSGAIMRHGPHHGAQKSTTTGTGALWTIASNDATSDASTGSPGGGSVV